MALISAPLTVVLLFGRTEARPSTGNLLPSPVRNNIHCDLFGSYLKGKAPSPKQVKKRSSNADAGNFRRGIVPSCSFC